MSVQIDFNSRNVERFLDDVHNAAIKKALPSTLNRTISKLRTRVKRRISQKTGVAQKQIQDLIRIGKAFPQRPVASLSIRAKTPNAIRFGAKETKKHLTVRTFRKRQSIKTGFIGNSGRTAFRREKGAKRLPIRAVYGPNVARAFGARKNMRVYQRFARIILNKEFEARYKHFANQIRSRKRR